MKWPHYPIWVIYPQVWNQRYTVTRGDKQINHTKKLRHRKHIQQQRTRPEGVTLTVRRCVFQYGSISQPVTPVEWICKWDGESALFALRRYKLIQVGLCGNYYRGRRGSLRLTVVDPSIISICIRRLGAVGRTAAKYVHCVLNWSSLVTAASGSAAAYNGRLVRNSGRDHHWAC